MQFEQRTALSGGKIQAAVLRPDGRIYVQVDGNRYRAGRQPKQVSQIAISDSGLWCIDKRNRVFQLHGQPSSFHWQQDSSVVDAILLGCLPSGHVYAVTKQGEALVHKEDGEETTGWKPDRKIAEWLDTTSDRSHALRIRNSQRNKRWLRRFKAMTLLFILGIALLPLLRTALRVRRQAHIARLVKISGAELYYEHQYDDSGEWKKNAPTPGPEWLRKLIGDHWFLTPRFVKSDDWNKHILALPTLRFLECDGKFDPAELAALPELEELVGDRATFTNFKGLKQLRHLKRLELWCPNWNFEDADNVLEILGSLNQLESLMILDSADDPLFWREQPFNTSLLKNLQELRSLKIYLNWQPVDTRPLTDLKRLESLETSKVSDFDHLAELTHLKELSVECDPEQRENISALATLANLESIALDHCAVVSDLQWISGMRNLKRILIHETDNIHYEIDPIHIDDPSPLYELRNLEKLSVPNIENLDRQRLFENSNLNPEVTTRSNPFLQKEQRALNLQRSNIRDLSFLAKMPDVQLVSLQNNQISDISPIAQWKDLDQCWLDGNPVTDLTPLREMRQLTKLGLSNTRVVDVSPLSDLPLLKSLTLRDCPIEDIRPIAALAGLRELDLGGTQVSDLTPLKDLTSLQTLSLARLDLRDMNFKIDCSPTSLDLSHTTVSSVTQLPVGDTSKITKLNLSGTNICSLEGLQRMPKLAWLDLSDTRVTDLSPLEGCKQLKRLNLANTQVSNIGSLTNCKALESIDLSGTQLEEPEQLLTLGRLTKLNLANTGLSDLTSMPLVRQGSFHWHDWISAELDLSGCPIGSIGSVIGKIQGVVALRLDCSELTDLSGLSTLPNVQVLALENLRPDTDLSFIGSLKPLMSLEVTGPALDPSPLVNAIPDLPLMRVLHLPSGTTIDPEHFQLLQNMEVYVGGKRNRFVDGKADDSTRDEDAGR